MSRPYFLPTSATFALAVLAVLPAAAQTQPPGAPAAAAPPASTSATPAAASPPFAATGTVTLDRVAAIVNGDLILDSDIEAERRFAAFQPFRDAAPMTRKELLNRLIDRDLILQQMALEAEPPITDLAIDDELAALRKTIPKCAAYHCDTEAGWQRFVADQGFTMAELRDRWRIRMEVLRFIEERFRAGIQIAPAQIDAYYKTTLLPQYAKEKATPPPEASIADHIQEILLEQQVDKLLDDWLAALRAQGSVIILKPAEGEQ